MIRTQEEWVDWCLKRRTSGDLVFTILSDWETEKLLWEQEKRILEKTIAEISLLLDYERKIKR